MADITGTVKDAFQAAASAVASAFSTEKPREIVDGEAFYAAAMAEQRSFHQTWFQNIAAFVGQHWLNWNASSNFLQESAAPSWRVRLTANFVLPNVRTQVAKLLRNNPRFFGMPGKDDPAARQSAKIAGRVFEGVYHQHDFQNRLIRLAHWAKMTGTSWLWPLWDPGRGRQWTDTVKGQDGQDVLDDNGQPVLQTFTAGDIVYEVTNSFETIMQPGAPEDFDEHRRIMRAKWMHVKDIEDRWGKKVQEEKVKTDTSFHARVLALVDAAGLKRLSDAGDGGVLKDHALVKELFEVPTREFPNGRDFIYANGVVLEETHSLDYWYNGRRALPCAKLDDIFVPGRAQGMSTIENTAQLNFAFNKLTSAALENLNLLGRPKVLSPVGSLEDNTFTSEPGEIVEYTSIGGLKPEAFKPPEVPNYFFTVRDSLPMLIEEVTSVHEVSKGRLPRRANSGVAIEALQNADDTQVSLNVKNLAGCLTRAMSIALNTMQEKYVEERLSRMVGPSHELDVKAFKGADLKGADMVRVVIDHDMSRSERVSVGEMLLSNKVITVDQFLQIVELGDLNVIFDQDAAQSQYANYENMGMAKGVLHPVGQFENHAAHMQSHDAFLNSPLGQRLDPEIRAFIEQHMHEHQAFNAAQTTPLTSAPSGPALAAPAPPAGVA